MSGTIANHWNALKDAVQSRSISAYGEYLTFQRQFREVGEKRAEEPRTASPSFQERNHARAENHLKIIMDAARAPETAEARVVSEIRPIDEGRAARESSAKDRTFDFGREAGKLEKAIADGAREHHPRTVVGELDKAAWYRERAGSPQVTEYAKGMARHYVESARQVRQEGGPRAEKQDRERWNARETERKSLGQFREMERSRSYGIDR